MNRRIVLPAVAVAGLLLAACGGDDSGPGESVAPVPTTTVLPASTTTLGPPPTTAAAPQEPPGGSLEVLVLGDSVMFDAAGAIEAAVESGGSATVQPSAVFGFGFSDGAAVPFAAAAPDLLAANPADQVVVMVGSWDHLAVQRDPEAYAGSVRTALADLTAGGRSVLLLGEPPSAPEKGEEPARLALNEVLRREAAATPGVRYLSTDRVIGDADGAYLAADGGQDLRKSDGRHLCPAGAERFGRAVRGVLTQAWVLDPADPGWPAGSWRDDPRYDVACVD